MRGLRDPPAPTKNPVSEPGTGFFVLLKLSKGTAAGGFEQGGGAKHRKQSPGGALLSPRVWRIGMSTVTTLPAGKDSSTQDSTEIYRQPGAGVSVFKSIKS